jgi:hypothetical protein
MALLVLNTISDLNRYLSAQRAMSRRALRELDQIIEEVQSISNDAEIASILMSRQKDLIEKYAITPTLLEFSKNPSLDGISHWGTTFCVTVLFSEIILSHVRILEEKFVRVHRLLAMLLMKEMDSPSPGDNDLVDTAMSFIKIELRQDMECLSEAERTNLIRKMISPLVTAMLTVFVNFDLVAFKEGEGYYLTDIGRQVLYHLFDGQRFIDEVVAAHERFKKDIPKVHD